MVWKSTTVKRKPDTSRARVYRDPVARRSNVTGPPKVYVEGPFLEGEVTGPVVARYAQELARNLYAALEGRSLREAGRAAELDHTTLSAILAGERWPDLVTIAKLEQGLGVRLWPDLVETKN